MNTPDTEKELNRTKEDLGGVSDIMMGTPDTEWWEADFHKMIDERTYLGRKGESYLVDVYSGEAVLDVFELKALVGHIAVNADGRARADWLRSEIEKLEGMKDDYPVDAQPTTNEYEVRINWANPVVREALTTIITRYKEELKVLESK